MRRLLLLPHGGWRPALCLDCAYVAAVLVDRKLRGGGCRVLWQDVEALGAQMQHTWLTFARTGTPPPAPPRSSVAGGGGCAGGVVMGAKVPILLTSRADPPAARMASAALAAILSRN